MTWHPLMTRGYPACLARATARPRRASIWYSGLLSTALVVLRYKPGLQICLCPRFRSTSKPTTLVLLPPLSASSPTKIEDASYAQSAFQQHCCKISIQKGNRVSEFASNLPHAVWSQGFQKLGPVLHLQGPAGTRIPCKILSFDRAVKGQQAGQQGVVVDCLVL